MFGRILLGGMAVLAGSALVVQAAPLDDLKAATQKLADADNYSWKATTVAANGGFGGGSTTGKTQKDGLISVSQTNSFGGNDTTTEALIKGDKLVIKGDSGWQTADEITAAAGGAAGGGGGGGGGGGFNPATFAIRRFTGFKAPVAQIQDIEGKVTDVTKADDAWTADLSAADATTLLSTGRGRGGRRGGGGGGGGAGGAGGAPATPPPAPAITNPKASVKFWITDGVLTKYELHTSGSMSFNGNDIDIDTTATTEFSDVGKTTIDVPADAKTKLGL